MRLDSRTGAREEPVLRNHHNHEGKLINMARPESINDIELNPVQFATVQVDAISAHAGLLKAYATFMEAVEKAGAEVEVKYNGATFERQPTHKEQEAQLKSKQDSWDEGKKQYELLAAVGATEYSYQRGMAQRWAEGEGLPFPPDFEPLVDGELLEGGIDEVTAR